MVYLASLIEAARQAELKANSQPVTPLRSSLRKLEHRITPDLPEPAPSALKRSRRQDVEAADTIKAPAATALQALVVAAPPPSVEQPLEAGEAKILVTLFACLESVLQLRRPREVVSCLPAVRADVEMHSRKSLTDTRLGFILTLANGMIQARWHAQGAVELIQVTAERGERATPEELPARRSAFEAAVQSALLKGVAPVQELPAAPAAQKPAAPSALTSEAADAEQHEGSEEKPGKSEQQLVALGSDRMEQLRQRVLAKSAFRASQVFKATEDTRRRVSLCHDAMSLHAIIAHLFTKNENPFGSKMLFARKTGLAASSTSEAEVVSAATSQSFGMQNASRQMTAEHARAALAHLCLHASEWFVVEEGKHNVGAKYLRRHTTGSASTVMTSLMSEHQEQRRLFLALSAGGPAAAVAAAAWGKSFDSHTTDMVAFSAASELGGRLADSAVPLAKDADQRHAIVQHVEQEAHPLMEAEKKRPLEEQHSVCGTSAAVDVSTPVKRIKPATALHESDTTIKHAAVASDVIYDSSNVAPDAEAVRAAELSGPQSLATPCKLRKASERTDGVVETLGKELNSARAGRQLARKAAEVVRAAELAEQLAAKAAGGSKPPAKSADPAKGAAAKAAAAARAAHVAKAAADAAAKAVAKASLSAKSAKATKGTKTATKSGGKATKR